MKYSIKSMLAVIAGYKHNSLSRSELYKRHFTDVEIQENCVISLDSKIGPYTYVGINTTITKSYIGRFCSIANNVSIGDGEHDLNKISTSSHFYEHPYQELTQGDCVIGNDVWIGTKSVIRRGVIIGNGAVIGANSFVNKDVPDFAIVVGTPARILRYRFSDDIIAAINKSKWWDLDMINAKKTLVKLEALLNK